MRACVHVYTYVCVCVCVCVPTVPVFLRYMQRHELKWFVTLNQPAKSVVHSGYSDLRTQQNQNTPFSVLSKIIVLLKIERLKQ